MNDQEGDTDQRRDAILVRLLKMPPQTQAELKRALAARRKPTRNRGKRASAGKREPSA